MKAEDGTDQGNLNQQGADGVNLGWRAQLPDDLKANETFTPLKTVGDLAKVHLDTTAKVKDLEGKLGESIPKLKDNATDEERTAYFKALGRPDKADDYKFEKLTPPEGAKVDPQMEGWFKSIAHQAGLSATQAAMIHKAYSDAYFAAHTAAEAQKVKDMEMGVENLKKEWGAKFDENVALVNKATSVFMTPEEKKHMDESGKGNDPVLVKMFHRIGLAMADDQFVPGSTTGVDGEEKIGMNYTTMGDFKGG
jgi:hypothetical protein